MSVSDQLFVSHFLIPQRLRVMISQILLTCLSSGIGTHLQHSEWTFFTLCVHFVSREFYRDAFLPDFYTINALVLTSPKRRPVSCGSIGSELRLLKSLISRDLAIGRQWLPLITEPSSPTPPPHGHITVDQHLTSFSLSLKSDYYLKK